MQTDENESKTVDYDSSAANTNHEDDEDDCKGAEDEDDDDSNGDNNAGLYIRGKPYPKPTMSRYQPVVSIVGDNIRTNHIQSEKITTNEINSSSELLILQKNGKENSKNLEVQAKISNIGGKVFNNEMREVGLGLGSGP